MDKSVVACFLTLHNQQHSHYWSKVTTRTPGIKVLFKARRFHAKYSLISKKIRWLRTMESAAQNRCLNAVAYMSQHLITSSGNQFHNTALHNEISLRNERLQRQITTLFNWNTLFQSIPVILRCTIICIITCTNYDDNNTGWSKKMTHLFFAFKFPFLLLLFIYWCKEFPFYTNKL